MSLYRPHGKETCAYHRVAYPIFNPYLPRNWNPIDHRISICTKLNLYIVMYHRPFAHFRDFVSEIIPFTTLPVIMCESSISSRKIFWIFTQFAYLQIMRILCFVVLYIAIARLATILPVVGIRVYNCRIKSGICKGLLNFHSLFLKFWFFSQLQSIINLGK